MGRFINPTNFGNVVTLDGTRADASGKLLRLQDAGPNDSGNIPNRGVFEDPYIVAISSNIIPGVGVFRGTLGPVLKGNFGTGGASHSFEVDVKPDTIFSLPGTSCDLNVVWDEAIETTPTGQRFTRGSAPGLLDFLPETALIRGTMKHGSISRPNATRTNIIFLSDAGVAVRLPVPPFSVDYMLYASFAMYAADVTLRFFAGNVEIVAYTGPEILAIRNIGDTIPVPGLATEYSIVATATTPGLGYHTFGLNL